MKRTGTVLTAALACSGAIACELPPGGQEIANHDRSITLSYRPDPARLEVDKQFSMIVNVCARAPLEGVIVDAHMPDHRHGMNYRTSVAMTAPGIYRANGLLLHMPGKWEFLFDLRVNGKTERLTHTIVVE